MVTGCMHRLTAQDQQSVLDCGTYQGHRTEARRIPHHLKNNIRDTRNLILVTGLQAENTVGQKIVAPDLKKVFLVRGELPARKALADAIQSQYGLSVEIPAPGNSYDLE